MERALNIKSRYNDKPVTRWLEVTQYSKKRAMIIVNLVETTWLVRYPWPVEITYDRGG